MILKKTFFLQKTIRLQYQAVIYSRHRQAVIYTKDVNKFKYRFSTQKFIIQIMKLFNIHRSEYLTFNT